MLASSARLNLSHQIAGQMNHKVVGILGGSKPFFYLSRLGVAKNEPDQPLFPSRSILIIFFSDRVLMTLLPHDDDYVYKAVASSDACWPPRPPS